MEKQGKTHEQHIKMKTNLKQCSKEHTKITYHEQRKLEPNFEQSIKEHTKLTYQDFSQPDVEDGKSTLDLHQR